jgi:hypothetical protein
MNSKIPNVRGIRADIVEAMKEIHAPILHWPGGCFPDEYHWKDGMGPDSLRPSMVNTNWGGVTEDNSLGTSEYLDLCPHVGCESYFAPILAFSRASAKVVLKLSWPIRSMRPAWVSANSGCLWTPEMMNRVPCCES